MKIAVTAQGPGLEDLVDPRFGRAAYILIIDQQTREVVEAVDNMKNIQAFKGAGIQAATMVSDKGAKVLLTGYCGPNAFTTLKAAGVQVVNDVTGTVAEALATFARGDVQYSEQPNTDGHW
ncbi:NifB/NifX family molybdenum-iron cluster-binding protein [Desulfosediminicola ganghwensis]|uniref:NifB/NifX family molybdenum-iron cluster-binding protein n=1 Tax=Desulfosediminicola ganghwensis TaxID=2569540 RepID=UPI0010AD578E|nr:NifB/NifX family molybdenum-iron cluster-binding protein [Desulfosediminicola ganghwensis]